MDHIGHKDEGNEGDEAVVTICFNEVMSCDSQRVNVVFTERPDEGLGGGGGKRRRG